MTPLRLAFMGSPDFSVPILNALVDAGHDVVCVYAQPPRPSGRGHRVRPCPVHARADQPAIRLLVAGTKGSRARLAMLPPVILHPPGTGNAFTPEADALINGQVALSMQA